MDAETIPPCPQCVTDPEPEFEHTPSEGMLGPDGRIMAGLTPESVELMRAYVARHGHMPPKYAASTLHMVFVHAVSVDGEPRATVRHEELEECLQWAREKYPDAVITEEIRMVRTAKNVPSRSWLNE